MTPAQQARTRRLMRESTRTLVKVRVYRYFGPVRLRIQSETRARVGERLPARGRRLRANPLDGHTAHVHLELEFRDRRTAVVPREAAAVAGARYDLLAQNGVELVHGIDL
jgi:hypothetical protein